MCGTDLFRLEPWKSAQQAQSNRTSRLPFSPNSNHEIPARCRYVSYQRSLLARLTAKWTTIYLPCSPQRHADSDTPQLGDHAFPWTALRRRLRLPACLVPTSLPSLHLPRIVHNILLCRSVQSSVPGAWYSALLNPPTGRAQIDSRSACQPYPRGCGSASTAPGFPLHCAGLLLLR